MKVTASLVKLTVFAVVTILATGLLAMTIGNISFAPTHTYHAEFTDATGLLPGDDVRIAGVRVGHVTGVHIAQRRYAMVSFTVDTTYRLSASTAAAIRYRNLVGQRYVALTDAAGSGGSLRPGATIGLDRTSPALDLTLLFNGFKPLFTALTPADVNRLSMEIIKTLQGEGGTVDSLLASTASLTNTLADRDAVIGRVVDNLNTVLATVSSRSTELSSLIVQLQRLVTGLAADRGTIAQAIGNIGDLTSSTAGLLADARPSLKTDIGHLGSVAQTLATTRNAKGQNVLDEYLHRIPTKLNTILRTATYGSWFNFYLCDFEVETGGKVIASSHTDVPSCGGGS
jgi:phospholipid/cholesterol/gamma-HCH transport system substrate-binding protein